MQLFDADQPTHFLIYQGAIPRHFPMARKRADNYDSKQQSILTSAAAVFAELGMEKASMAQIANRGKISKALLYHYYSSKSALIFDIVRSHLAELDAALEAVDQPDSDPEVRLRLLIGQVLESYRHSDNQHKVQLNCTATLTDEQMEALRQFERSITHRFSKVISTINPQLTSGSTHLMPVTMSLFGILNWVYLWFRDDGRVTREEYAELVTTMMLKGIGGIG